MTRVQASPDGLLFASGYSDGAIRIWDSNTLELLSTFNGHTKPVTVIRFSSDGTLLASGSQSTEVIVWDILGQEGKMRLRSHKGSVTSLRFTDKDQTLISASKDSMVLVWDLNIQTCVQTLTGHRHEVWAVEIDEANRRLITGSGDNKLRVWKMDDPKEYEYFGTIDRSTDNRALQIQWLHGQRLAVLSAGKMVEVFSTHDDAMRSKKKKRRLKREKEKLAKKQADLEAQVGVPGFNLDEAKEALLSGYVAKGKASDEYSLTMSFASDHKLTGMSSTENKVAVLSNRNEVQLWRVGSKEAKEKLSIERTGHRSDVRSVSLDSTDSNVFSSSQAEGKIWNGHLEQVLGTVTLSGTGLCSQWLPLDKYIVVGTKEGKLDLVQVSSNSVQESISAHQGAIWDIQLLPDEKGIVSASADKQIKFWDYAVRKNSKGESTLTLTESRVMTMKDDVLSIAISANGRLIAAALLDSTIQVLYVDSFKKFLSLYGHSLPVLSIAISEDNNLLISASADKNVKIWGLDFGDCHRSLKAHDDAVTRVAFIANSHYFLSASKDGTLKYWDADAYEQVSVLRAHQAEIWCLAVSKVGDFFVSGSHDRSLRRWEQTEELLYPETEKRKEMDRLFAPAVHELTTATSRAQGELSFTKDGLRGLEGDVSAPTLPTAQSLRHSERLADAIERAFDNAALLQDWQTACRAAESQLSAEESALKRRKNEPALPRPEKDPLLLGMTPDGFLAHVFGTVPLGELESSLSLLSFTDALQFLAFCAQWLDLDAPGNAPAPEVVCRATFFLFRLHLREMSFAPKYRLQPRSHSTWLA